MYIPRQPWVGRRERLRGQEICDRAEHETHQLMSGNPYFLINRGTQARGIRRIREMKSAKRYHHSFLRPIVTLQDLL